MFSQALAKFLKCVKWEIAAEEKLALELLDKWAPMDVQDALELLGPQFTHPRVRSYAVQRLQQAPDEVSKVLFFKLCNIRQIELQNVKMFFFSFF